MRKERKVRRKRKLRNHLRGLQIWWETWWVSSRLKMLRPKNKKRTNSSSKKEHFQKKRPRKSLIPASQALIRSEECPLARHPRSSVNSWTHRPFHQKTNLSSNNNWTSCSNQKIQPAKTRYIRRPNQASIRVGIMIKVWIPMRWMISSTSRTPRNSIRSSEPIN